MKITFFFIVILGLVACSPEKNQNCINASISDREYDSTKLELVEKISFLDSILFQQGFNNTDTVVMSNLIHSDFEFYHDEHGEMNSKSQFLLSVQSLREAPFTTTRKKLNEHDEFYPLYTENHTIIYGVLQNGVHEFYQQKDGKISTKSSTAKFSHLWIRDGEKWKLKRVISYDHQLP